MICVVRRLFGKKSVMTYTLMMDANQKWDVGEAIENMAELAKYNPYWIEEPTSPDDVIGACKNCKSSRSN